MIKAGIIDPAKVTRSALQNAASIAALFLTTEAVIADKPEKAPAARVATAAWAAWTSSPPRSTHDPQHSTSRRAVLLTEGRPLAFPGRSDAAGPERLPVRAVRRGSGPCSGW